jgi:membrane protease YdiL (CAAX protease family)
MLVQVFVAKNAMTLGVPRAGAIVLGAFVFGIVHAPDWTLVAITAFSGLVWTWCFLRRPTLFPLALAHGWSGAFVYTWILDRSALR